MGAVTAMAAEISGDMVCTGGKFDALILERAKVERTLFVDNPKEAAPKIIDLAHARVGQLSDDERSWPAVGNLRINGFEYDAIAPGAPRDASSRLKWLRLTGEKHFSAQPYEQLEKVLRSSGDERGARAVYIEKRRMVRKTANLGAAARVGDWFLDWSIRYGYQTWRTLIWALLIVTIGAFSFWHWLQTPVLGEPASSSSAWQQPAAMKIAVEQQVGGGKGRPAASAQMETAHEMSPNVVPTQSRNRFVAGFDHFLFSFCYSLDVFLPFGDLHVKSAHPLGPRGPQDWSFYLLELWYVVEMISGWVIAALIASAITGLTKR